jgi:hypothetical protein
MKPIDSYRVGGNGMIHFYSGKDHVLTSPLSSSATLSKIQELNSLDKGKQDPEQAMRDYWRPVVDATTAEPKSAAPSFSAPPIRPGARQAMDRALRSNEGQGTLSPPPQPMPPAAPPLPSMSPADRAQMNAALQGQTGSAPSPAERQQMLRMMQSMEGGPPPGMPPGPPMPPPAPGAMPMGGNPLDDAYRRAQLDTSSRFGRF